MSLLLIESVCISRQFSLGFSSAYVSFASFEYTRGLAPTGLLETEQYCGEKKTNKFDTAGKPLSDLFAVVCESTRRGIRG